MFKIYMIEIFIYLSNFQEYPVKRMPFSVTEIR